MSDPKPSDERNGCFLDKQWCCKVCDGEIPDGHTDYCDIWKLEKKHRDFLANEYSNVLTERDRLLLEVERLREDEKIWRETVEAINDIPTNLSPAVCRAMAAYWNRLAEVRAVPSAGTEQP